MFQREKVTFWSFPFSAILLLFCFVSPAFSLTENLLTPPIKKIYLAIFRLVKLIVLSESNNKKKTSFLQILAQMFLWVFFPPENKGTKVATDKLLLPIPIINALS